MPNNSLGFQPSWLKPLNQRVSPFTSYQSQEVPQGVNGNFTQDINNISDQFDQSLRSQIDFGNQVKSNFNNLDLSALSPTNLPKLNKLKLPTSSEPDPIKEDSTKTKDNSTNSFGFGNYAKGALGLASGVTNILDINNSGLNSDQKRIMTGDATVNGLAQVGTAFGPIGTAIGAGLSLVNSIGGSLIGTPKVIKDFSINNNVATSSAYGGIASQAKDAQASGQSYQKAGLFGKLFGGKNKIVGKVNQSNYDQNLASGIINTNKTAIDAANNSSSMFANNYLNNLNGSNQSFYNGSIQYGQQGGSLIKYPVINSIQQSTKIDSNKISAPYVDEQNEVMKQYMSQEKDPIKIDALKKSLLKYGNPKLRFGMVPEGYDGTNEVFTNTITVPNGTTDKDKILNILIAEMSHSKQTENGVVPAIFQMAKDIPTYIRNRKSVYNVPGTMEYQAHSIIEPKLKEEYEHTINTQSHPFVKQMLNPSALSKIPNKRYQQGGILYNPIQSPTIEQFNDVDLTPQIKENNVIESSRLDQIAEQRRIIEQQNQELERQLNEKPQVQTTSSDLSVVNNSSSTNKFHEFENAGLQILQRLNPGKKVEIKFEDSGVYNKDGSRDWSTQSALLKKGSSHTGLSLHNFGAARDYRIVIDGKTISPDNKQLYKDVVWGAAKQTGLHTIGDWDIAHVGLAQEGKGSTWNELANKFPDVFKSQVSQNTINQLKNAGETKYLTQLEKPLASVSSFKTGGSIKPKSVIVHGNLHAHKHTLKQLKELRDTELTAKGIPVVQSSSEGGTLQQAAEIEREELVLHHELTMKLEELRKDGSEEACMKAGKLLARELMRNTKDKTGTLKSILNRGKELENV